MRAVLVITVACTVGMGWALDRLIRTEDLYYLIPLAFFTVAVVTLTAALRKQVRDDAKTER